MFRNLLVWCGLLLVLVVPSVAYGVEITQAEMENKRCLNCHGQSHIGSLSPAERLSMLAPASGAPLVAPPTTGAAATTSAPAVRPGLYTPGTPLAGSKHAKASCVSCHADAAGTLPHKPELAAATCASAACHAEAKAEFTQGAHAAAVAAGHPNAPTCVSCHGGHDVLPKDDRNARTFPLNLVKTCANCHQTHNGGHDTKDNVDRYVASVHGKAVLKGGMAVAATCADCHGNHAVMGAKDSRSLVHRERVATTCGKCHTGVSETFAMSVHGQKVKSGNAKAPVCVDCHTAHAITRTDTPAFKSDIVAECGDCHDKPASETGKLSLYETYRRSYHGQVTELGMNRAARCSDCHGAHDIKAAADPGSRVAGENRVETCRKCHPGANANFASFMPHADHRDAEKYPVLHYVFLYFVVMMTGAFGFFGIHCILWFVRNMIDRVKRGPYPKHHGNHGAKAIQRFNRVDRINHAFVIVSFFGLALTGLPLLYSNRGWGQTLADLFGGARSCGVLHRVFAIILILNFVVHGFGILNRIRKYGLLKLVLGPATMLPTPKDAKDAVGMFRWFFKGGKKPRFDRWTYYEKFDYMAEVGGSAIIGISGLLLWFPVFFSQFLPGWVFNIATIVHGYEALLAVVFIFTIHFFNAHLRFEKFPVDDVMFTGRLPEEEFKDERPAEYERLAASGELEGLRVNPAPKHYRILAVTAGILAMAIGFTVAALIIWEGLRQL